VLRQVMIVRITGVSDFVHCPYSKKLVNTTFRKLDLFPSSGEEGDRTPLGPLERANLNHWSSEITMARMNYFPKVGILGNKTGGGICIGCLLIYNNKIAVHLRERVPVK
jgi:hypothetical protein